MTEVNASPSSPIRFAPAADAGLWSPAVGVEWRSFVRRIVGASDTFSATAANQLESDCRFILSRCSPPNAPAQEPRTGLVLGQVQSGKTMSFTGVATLARDNGTRLVIVITGISVQLLEQSVQRLRRDLGIEQGSQCGWVHVPIEPNAQEPAARAALLRHLEMWNDPETLPHLRKTVLVTVMKNHANLRKLSSILRSIGGALGSGGLASVPTIVIDDEADQASLNTKVRTSELSTVYRHIRQLRAALPNHTMLQYTATPQAPLLLNIADILSPDFCKVLDPGADYVGGRAFFIDSPSLVQDIPSRDLGSNDSPPPALPETLLEAMRIFVLGVTAEIEKPNYQRRSMLVHPSSQTAVHAVFVQWVRHALDMWRRLLRQPDGDLDRKELLAEFETSHAALSATVPDLPPFARMAPLLRQAMLQIQIEEVNAANGATPIIKWESSPAWILVGGQALDRGFTVQGLTVSYMPRPLAASGTANADTLQQRARFFGYKRPYLGFCRIWLEGSVKHALTEYVEHEDALRDSLRSFEQRNRPLAEWRRRFILDGSMAPTRSNVIDIAWRESVAGPEPILLRFAHHDAPAVAANRLLVTQLRAKGNWKRTGDPTWTASQTHECCSDFDLRGICESFLLRFRTNALDDSEGLNARLLQFSEMLTHDPGAPADVLLMSSGSARHRTANSNDELDQFLQGANPASPGSGRVSYPGDRHVCRQDRVTIQIHILDVERPDGSIVREVPTLAVFAPTARGVRVITQPQGTTTT
jgi:hypothetical protein